MQLETSLYRNARNEGNDPFDAVTYVMVALLNAGLARSSKPTRQIRALIHAVEAERNN